MDNLVSIGFDINAKGINTANNALDNLLKKAGSVEDKLKKAGAGASKGLDEATRASTRVGAALESNSKQAGNLSSSLKSLGTVGVASFREYEQYAKKLTKEWEQIDRATKKAQQTFDSYSTKNSFSSALKGGAQLEAQYKKDLSSLRNYYQGVESADKKAEQTRKASFDREIKLIESAKAREQQAYDKDLAAMRKYYAQQEKEAAKAASIASKNAVTVGIGGRTPRPFDDGYVSRAKGVQDANTSLAKSFNILGLSLGQVGFGFLLQKTLEMADGYALLQSRMKLFSDASDDLGAVNQRLLAISNSNRASLEDTGRLYVKLLQPLRELGSTSEQVLTVTDAFSKALFVGGANAREASAAIIQFSQAMASGKLSGDRRICHPTK